MKKWQNKLFMNDIRKAVDDYNMIEDRDRIIIGLSGGKDSTLLLYALNLLNKYSYKNFEIIGVHLDCGFDLDFNPMIRFCENNGIKLHIEETSIRDYLDFEGDKNPCYLCGRLRRGALGRVAKKLGASKIALGHHMDDAIETFFMNMIYTGKLGSFNPKNYEKEKGLYIIRPLIYIKEEIIRKVVDIEKLPVISSNCPMDGCTSRQDIKELIVRLAGEYPDIKEKIITSLSNIDTKNIWKQRKNSW